MPKKKSVSALSESEFMDILAGHIGLSVQIKELTKQKEELAKKLKDNIAAYGTTTATGSIIYSASVRGTMLQASLQVSVTTSLVPEAADILELTEFKDMVETDTVKYVNTEALAQAGIDGRIPPELLERLYSVNSRFSLYTKKSAGGTMEDKSAENEDDI